MMDARPIVEKSLTNEELDAIAVAITAAYRGCTDFMRLSPVTETFPVGVEQRPHLLRSFIDYSLMRLADTLPGFNHEMRWNAASNCRHVRIYKGGLAITAHYMGRNDFRTAARPAECRDVLAARNADLFGFEAGELDISDRGGYVQILHGGRTSPDFITLAIPSRDQREHLASMELTISVAGGVEPEAIRDEITVKVKPRMEHGGNDVGEKTG